MQFVSAMVQVAACRGKACRLRGCWRLLCKRNVQDLLHATASADRATNVLRQPSSSWAGRSRRAGDRVVLAFPPVPGSSASAPQDMHICLVCDWSNTVQGVTQVLLKVVRQQACHHCSHWVCT
jgi:hypothetical protein